MNYLRFLLGLAIIIGVMLMLAYTALPAAAHDFYSAACCSERDCGPASPGDVTWTPAGYRVLSTDETIQLSDPRVQYSPPGEPGFRLCVPPYRTKVRCLYVPEPEG